MSAGLFTAIERILDNGELPDRYKNRTTNVALLAGLVELAQRQERADEIMRELLGRVERIEQYPSILRLLWTNPKSTIAFIAFVFLLLTLAYRAGSLPLF